MPPKQQNTKEIRTYAAASPVEIRTTADGSKQLAGYAIRYNSPSQDLGGFTEICSPGMLTRTLKENPDVLCLRDHKSELLLGRTSAGTLALTEDAQGLAFVVTLPKTAIGDDTAENVRLRNLSGCSFGFVVADSGDRWEQKGTQLVRTLLDVDLFEISITSFPAYSATSVNTRSCPARFRNHLRPETNNGDAANVPIDDEGRCECRCGLDGCASLVNQYDNELDDDAETDSLRHLRLTLHRRMAV
jgi:uncharacterized protein